MTQPLPLETIASLSALEAAAAPGPWENCHDGHSPENGKLGNWVETRAYASLPDPENSECVVSECPNSSHLAADNTRLIAAARNALPALLEMAREHARRERLVDALLFNVVADRPVFAKLSREQLEEFEIGVATELGWKDPTKAEK